MFAFCAKSGGDCGYWYPDPLMALGRAREPICRTPTAERWLDDRMFWEIIRGLRLREESRLLEISRAENRSASPLLFAASLAPHWYLREQPYSLKREARLRLILSHALRINFRPRLEVLWPDDHDTVRLHRMTMRSYLR